MGLCDPAAEAVQTCHAPRGHCLEACSGIVCDVRQLRLQTSAAPAPEAFPAVVWLMCSTIGVRWHAIWSLQGCCLTVVHQRGSLKVQAM